MNKEASTNNGIKDSISKLFILRDSCRGTYITQKENQNIIWYEGASVLLQQMVDKLKSARIIIESEDKDAGADFCQNLKETISKLIVLKRSWIITRSEESDENAVWFEGAEFILCEVINQLQKAIQEAETKAEAQAAEEAKSEEVKAAVESDDNAGDDVSEKQKSKPPKEESKTTEEKKNDAANDTQEKVKSNA